MSQGKLVCRALPCGSTPWWLRAVLVALTTLAVAALLRRPESSDDRTSVTSVTNITRAGHVYEHSKICPCRWK